MTTPSGCTLKLQLQHFLLRESANSHADADAVDDQTVSLETAVLVVLGRSHLSLSLSPSSDNSVSISLSLSLSYSAAKSRNGASPSSAVVSFEVSFHVSFSLAVRADESATLSLALFPDSFFHPKRFEGQV